MTTNKCPERCNNFTVIDHAEALIPSRFRHLYVERKDKLLATHGTPFAALSAFLNTQAVLIQKHMPNKITNGASASASKDSPTPKELRR